MGLVAHPTKIYSTLEPPNMWFVANVAKGGSRFNFIEMAFFRPRKRKKELNKFDVSKKYINIKHNNIKNK
jgi:hypothetical protein